MGREMLVKRESPGRCQNALGNMCGHRKRREGTGRKGREGDFFNF